MSSTGETARSAPEDLPKDPRIGPRGGKVSKRYKSDKREKSIPLKYWLLGVSVFTMAAAATISGDRDNRIIRNQHDAITTLMNIPKHQTVWRGSGFLDSDCDTIGEYGYLQQLGGVVKVPDPDQPERLISPYYLGVHDLNRIIKLAESASENNGVARLGGYYFELWFHDTPGGVAETKECAPPSDEEASNTRERRWTVYAWPIEWDETGRNTYAVTEEGHILRTKAELAYEGERGPEGAACRVSRSEGSEAAGGVGADGNLWQSVARALTR